MGYINWVVRRTDGKELPVPRNLLLDNGLRQLGVLGTDRKKLSVTRNLLLDNGLRQLGVLGTDRTLFVQ